jgi:predicted Fe-Mo cluster-binding NifX family protein
MKIALASEGKELSSRIDPRFGRARYILIYDTGSGELEILDNSETSQLPGGAGVKAAENIAAKGVDHVVSQNFGRKALEVLKAAHIGAAVFSDGTVAEAIELSKRGRLNFI